MAAKTTVKVALTNSAAKDDVFSLGESATDSWTLDVLGNDPGSATLYSIGTPVASSDGSGQMVPASTSTFSYGGAVSGTGTMSIEGGKIAFNLGGYDSDTLAVGQSITFTVSYTAKMANGVLSTANVSVTIAGSNDGPVANADVGATTENAPLTIDALANDTDIDNGAALSLVSATAPTGKGSASVVDGKVVFDPGTDFDHLPAGVAEVVTVNYTMTDEHGAESSSTIEITVTGENDEAVIGGDTAGEITEADAAGSASGVLTVVDVDDGEAFFVPQTDAEGDYGTFQLAADGTWSYQMDGAHDEFEGGVDYTDSITVTTVDGTTETLTVTIHGTNDAPELTSPAQTGSVTEEDSLTATGNVDATDAEGDTLSYAVSGSATGTYGSISVNSATGEWTYTLANASAAVQGLNTGDVRHDIFTIEVSDGKGGTVSQQVDVTINGKDEPVTTVTTAPVTTTDTPPSDTNNNNELNPGGGSNADLSGTDGANQIVGGALSQTINGNGGDDIIYARGGNDTVNGGSGLDTAYGQDGSDTINGGDGNDTIYGGTNGDTLNGDAGNDTIYGGSGVDTINGGADNDAIYGGLGADNLTGGGGDDTFHFLTLSDIGDTISDFNAVGNDTIDLSALDADGAAGSADAFTGYFGTTATAHGVWSATVGGDTVVYADTDGNTSTAEFWVTLTGTVALTSADFVL
jgi:VCBS repeat-containing protein